MRQCERLATPGAPRAVSIVGRPFDAELLHACIDAGNHGEFGDAERALGLPPPHPDDYADARGLTELRLTRNCKRGIMCGMQDDSGEDEDGVEHKDAGTGNVPTGSDSLDMQAVLDALISPIAAAVTTSVPRPKQSPPSLAPLHMFGLQAGLGFGLCVQDFSRKHVRARATFSHEAEFTGAF